MRYLGCECMHRSCLEVTAPLGPWPIAVCLGFGFRANVTDASQDSRWGDVPPVRRAHKATPTKPCPESLFFIVPRNRIVEDQFDEFDDRAGFGARHMNGYLL